MQGRRDKGCRGEGMKAQKNGEWGIVGRRGGR